MEFYLFSNFYREFSEKSIFRQFFKNYKNFKFFLQIRIENGQISRSQEQVWTLELIFFFEPKFAIFGFGAVFFFEKRLFRPKFFSALLGQYSTVNPRCKI
jgi:hypothetical protein